jgi:ComEC/Rec2-related protein
MNLDWFYKKKSKTELLIIWFVSVAAFFTIMYFRYNFVTSRSQFLMERVDRYVVLHGIIVTEPDNFGFKKSLTVEVDKIKIDAYEVAVNKGGSGLWLQNFLNIRRYFDSSFRKNRIRVITSCSDCRFGHPIEFSGTLSLPKITEDFDSNIFLLSRGIQFEMLNAKIGKIYDLNPGSNLENSLYDFKNLFVEKIKSCLPNKEEAALGSGILITGKGELSKKTLEDFKRSGLIHMVVLSGFNVSIVAQVIIAVLSFLPKIITGILGSVGIILFCIMVGGGATVVRSLIMSLIVIFAKVFDVNHNALKTVLIAGVLMLINNPIIIIGDPSFQLSFACTLAVILLGNSSKYFFNFLTDKFGLREIVSSTVAVQIFTLPLLLKFSGAVSSYGILANIIVVPFIPFAMLAVFIAGSLCFINIDLSIVFALVSHFLLAYMLFVVKYVSGLDSALLKIGKTSDLFILCWYLIIIPISYLLYVKFIDNPSGLSIRKIKQEDNKKSIKIDG